MYALGRDARLCPGKRNSRAEQNWGTIPIPPKSGTVARRPAQRYRIGWIGWIGRHNPISRSVAAGRDVLGSGSGRWCVRAAWGRRRRRRAGPGASGETRARFAWPCQLAAPVPRQGWPPTSLASPGLSTY